MKSARRVQDPEAGRYLVDFAYSHGCLFELGDTDAWDRLQNVIKPAGMPRTGEHALVSQFRMGQLHERAR